MKTPRKARSLLAGSFAIVLALSAGACSDNRGDGRGWLGGSPGVVAACPMTAPTCPDSGVPTYTNDLAPILQGHCTGCHGPGGENQDKPLATYEDLKMLDNGRPRGQTAVSFAVNCQMPPPPLPPLTDRDRTTFYCWFAGGEKE